MWLPNPKATGIRKGGGGNGLVAVAIDKDKGSQYALKWAADSLLTRGQTVILIHVVHKPSSLTSIGGSQAVICNISNLSASQQKHQLDKSTKELFLTFHCYCTRKDIQCLDVLLEDSDVVKGITEFLSYAAIENLVVGATSRHGFIRFKSSTTPSGISKGAPDFCTVYVISKGKISSVRNASRPAPHSSPLLSNMQNLNKQNDGQQDIPSRSLRDSNSFCSRVFSESVFVSSADKTPVKPHSWQDEPLKSAYARGGRGGLSGRSCVDFSDSDTDISFVSSGRPSSDCPSSVFYDYMDSTSNPRISISSDHSAGSSRLGLRLLDTTSPDVSFSQDSSRTSFSYSSQTNMDEAENDMRRLKLELKQTMDMYSTACREALTAQQKMSNRRREEEKKLEESRLAQEAAIAIAEKEKARSKVALETAEAAKKIAVVESHKRASVESKALKEAEEMRKLLDNLAQTDVRYRRYSIEEIEVATEYFSASRKIGEGGYGPVYKCYLDHTPAAVKVLRPDAAQGKSQFQQEVDILSCIRHPNMVLLLGACPEYGILIYEYMANGSLEDCLFQKRKQGYALSWQLRFRIATEIATGLLFLHQTKPEPLVHRDLKPGNILLDHNYVSKIGDVGLARLLPAVAENVTQCRMTSAAGTFCYIDPEYQQTGMLGTKSDVYSLGIMYLQLITAKPAMGLAHNVEQSIENGKFEDMLDPSVPDWPIEQTLHFAKLSLQCAELRRKDRPDLATMIMPELSKLREFAEENMSSALLGGNDAPSPTHSQVSIQQDVMSDPQLGLSGNSSTLSTPTEGKAHRHKELEFQHYQLHQPAKKEVADLQMIKPPLPQRDTHIPQPSNESPYQQNHRKVQRRSLAYLSQINQRSNYHPSPAIIFKHKKKTRFVDRNRKEESPHLDQHSKMTNPHLLKLPVDEDYIGVWVEARRNTLNYQNTQSTLADHHLIVLKSIPYYNSSEKEKSSEILEDIAMA
ncbi:U-box domain-containing protein 35 [Senna tora]|uniref:U-box domain-containing protein 35 n=1 Tax=Senna tora TaxID=362788 RepID=A0A834WAX6_9FABA|nr:U-box domain-containing protein 35 [Senna tora]